jgi:hypothetical protein
MRVSIIATGGELSPGGAPLDVGGVRGKAMSVRLYSGLMRTDDLSFVKWGLLYKESIKVRPRK